MSGSKSYTFTATVTEQGSGLSANWQQPFTVTPAFLTGCTQGITYYPAGTSMGQAIAQWNAIPGMPATQSAKVYYNPGAIPTTFDTGNYHNLNYFVANGIKCLLCIKPDANGDQVSAVQQFLALCQQAGLKADVILWQEVNDNQLTAASFISMWNTYAPAVRNAATVTLPGGGTWNYTGYPCCIDFALNLTNGDASVIGPYFTSGITTGTVDKLYVDFYGKDWDIYQQSIGGANGRNLTYVASLADAPPSGGPAIPFGIGEFNVNMGGTTNPETVAQANAFFAYIVGFMGSQAPNAQFPSGGRLYQGKANADILAYNGAGPLAGPLIVDGTDPRVINGGSTGTIPSIPAVLNTFGL